MFNPSFLCKTQLFSYDDLDRLKTASESGGFDYAYEYSPIGNLTSFIASGSVTNYTYGQSAGPHALTSATASASFVYDDNGNMASDSAYLYEYNEANQLKRVNVRLFVKVF